MSQQNHVGNLAEVLVSTGAQNVEALVTMLEVAKVRQ
jgi:hypothetical protein